MYSVYTDEATSYTCAMNIILFEQLPQNNTLFSGDFRFNHIRKVLKLTKGDSCFIGEVNKESYNVVITSIDEKQLTYEIVESFPFEEPLPITLIVGQVRPISMKRILREAVSFGVKHILLVGTDTSERSYQEAKLYTQGGYKEYLLSGAMQSGKTAISSLTLYDSVDSFLQKSVYCPYSIILDNTSDAVPLWKLPPITQEVALAVGPERGWSERELNLFKKQGWTFASLGNRVLRTETACSASVALLLSLL
jgi:16S rRNA (uracil1498-N3)-methyltransferase